MFFPAAMSSKFSWLICDEEEYVFPHANFAGGEFKR